MKSSWASELGILFLGSTLWAILRRGADNEDHYVAAALWAPLSQWGGGLPRKLEDEDRINPLPHYSRGLSTSEWIFIQDLMSALRGGELLAFSQPLLQLSLCFGIAGCKGPGFHSSSGLQYVVSSSPREDLAALDDHPYPFLLSEE